MEKTVLQNVLLPETSGSDTTELYARFFGDATVFDGKILLSGGAEVSFDTYFGVFSIEKWKKYTEINDFSLTVYAKGKYDLTVSKRYFLPDGQQGNVTLFTKSCEDETTVSLPNETQGVLYFSLRAHGFVTFERATFNGALPNRKEIKLCGVICTYRREEYVKRNVSAIKDLAENETPPLRGKLDLIVVDNGKTLNSALIENEYVSLIPNNNTGGSGGFARGYYEAVSSGKDYTHILFMDDDMILDSEMLLRIYSLLRLRKAAYQNLSAGASMLKLSDRSTLHEAAAFWNGKQLTSIGNGLDMTNRDHVFTTACLPEGNYHAWWFYCFPANWQEIHGYPLPFFIKEDDIEYSLRCADHIASLCGIAVWHEDFDNKYDGFQEYYIKRNELILTSVCRQKPYAAFQIRKLILSVMKQTVFQRYFLADLIFRSYKDYLKGWKHFYLTNTIELNKELMASCAPLLSDEELQETYGVSFDIKKYERSLQEPENLKKQALTLNGYLIPTAFYRHDKDDFSVCDLAKCRIVNFYRHKRVLHYDINQKKGFVTVIKKRMLIKNIFRLIGLSCRFLICYPFVRRGYRRHMKELTSSAIHSFSPTPETLPVDLPIKKS